MMSNEFYDRTSVLGDEQMISYGQNVRECWPLIAFR